MASNLVKLSKKQRDSVLIHGYIRSQLETLNLSIPAQVIELFVEWYHIQLYFIKISRNQELNGDKTIVKQRTSAESAWASILMPSMDDMIYEYTVKITAPSRDVAIGIDENGYKRINSYFVEQMDSIHYALECWSGEKDSEKKGREEYGPRVGKTMNGVIIKMTYNAGATSLSFIVDGKDYGVAYDNVEQNENLNYRLAIYMNNTATVELLRVSINDPS